MNYTPIPPRDMPSSYVIVGEHTPRTGVGAELRQIWDVLISGWRLILFCIGAAVGLALLFVLVIPATYQAHTDVLLDPRQRQVVSGEVIDPRLGVSALGADTLMLDSQIQVVLSRDVLAEFIRSENLSADAELMGNVGSFVPFTASDQQGETPDIPYFSELVTEISDRLDVEREGNTYVIRISYRSENPLKAAHYTNRVAEIYLDQLNGSNRATTQEAADALEGRLASLRQAAQAANARVEQYRQDNGLIGTQDQLLVEQDLREINQQLALAKLATNDAEAQLAAVQSTINSNAPDALQSTALQSDVFTQLQIDLAALEVEEAQLRSRFLSRHPEIQRVVDQKAAITSAMQAESKRIGARLESQLQVARAKEAKLTEQTRALEAKASVSNAAQVRLRELEREALSSQSVYEAYLTRSQEVSQQTELPNETARIISRATPPTEPIMPKVPLTLGGALVIGASLGMGIVWVRHLVTSDGNTGSRVSTNSPYTAGQMPYPGGPQNPVPPQPPAAPRPPRGGGPAPRRPIHPGLRPGPSEVRPAPQPERAPTPVSAQSGPVTRGRRVAWQAARSRRNAHR